MAYDRDVIVNFFNSYYDLLVKLCYLDPAAIQRPPSEGWSDEELVVDIVRALGRSEQVIDLLRHLPYLRTSARYHIYAHDTEPITYLRDQGPFWQKTAQSVRENGLTMSSLLLMPWEEEECPHPPAGLISLTFGREAVHWIIDTEEGLIYPCDGYMHNEEAPEPWIQGAEKPRDIEEYLDEVYWDLYNLKIVPAFYETEGPVLIYGSWPEGKVVKRMLTEHGWPLAFRREEYMEAVRDYKAKQ